MYFKPIENYVYLKPTGTALTIHGYFPELENTQTKALLAGIDGLIHGIWVSTLNTQERSLTSMKKYKE